MSLYSTLSSFSGTWEVVIEPVADPSDQPALDVTATCMYSALIRRKLLKSFLNATSNASRGIRFETSHSSSFSPAAETIDGRYSAGEESDIFLLLAELSMMKLARLGQGAKNETRSQVE